jgi:hypothetical protein
VLLKIIYEGNPFSSAISFLFVFSFSKSFLSSWFNSIGLRGFFDFWSFRGFSIELNPCLITLLASSRVSLNSSFVSALIVSDFKYHSPSFVQWMFILYFLGFSWDDFSIFFQLTQTLKTSPLSFKDGRINNNHLLIIALIAIFIAFKVGARIGADRNHNHWEQVLIPEHRKDAISRSRSVLGGMFSENLALLLESPLILLCLRVLMRSRLTKLFLWKLRVGSLS